MLTELFEWHAGHYISCFAYLTACTLLRFFCTNFIKNIVIGIWILNVFRESNATTLQLAANEVLKFFVIQDE